MATDRFESQETQDDIAELNATDTSPTVLRDGIRYMKKHGIVMLDLYGSCAEPLAYNSWTKIGTLPEGYRPKTIMHTAVVLGSTANVFGILQVHTNGDMAVFQYNASAGTKYVWGGLSYPCA